MKTGPFRADELLNGDITESGVVADCTGQGDVVEVTYRDGTKKTFHRADRIMVEGHARC